LSVARDQVFVKYSVACKQLVIGPHAACAQSMQSIPILTLTPLLFPFHISGDTC